MPLSFAKKHQPNLFTSIARTNSTDSTFEVEEQHPHAKGGASSSALHHLNDEQQQEEEKTTSTSQYDDIFRPLSVERRRTDDSDATAQWTLHRCNAFDEDDR